METVEVFKKRLKTHLFYQAFNCMFPHGGLPDWELSLVQPFGGLSQGWFWPGRLGGSALWCGASCLPGLGWSLWQRFLRPWTEISLSVVAPPKGSFLHTSGLAAQPRLSSDT